MPRRFIKDVGLTVRMTTVMFLLGALFVALIVALMFAAASAGYGGSCCSSGWPASASRSTSGGTPTRSPCGRCAPTRSAPEEMPELHGMIDRLCALAEMPKPRVGISEMDIPNAFATGRSPDRAVVCVTTGIMGKLTPEELEGVLAHELSHVAHRDVLVMTVASSAGIVAGMLMQGAQYGALFGRARPATAPSFFFVTLVISLVVYAISFFLLRLLSRYRELCADRAGAYLTMKPAALASALQKITGEMAAIPQKDLRASKAMNAFFIAPAISGASPQDPHLDAPVARAAARAAGPDPGRAGPHRAADGDLGRRPRAQSRRPGRTSTRCSWCRSAAIDAADQHRPRPGRHRLGLLPGRRGRGVPADAGRGGRAAQRRPGGARRAGHAPTTSASPG